MRRFGWMRLACLFLVLSVLAALVRDGGAEARSLAARVPDAMFLAPESPEEPPVTPRTEGQISALEDLSEDALRMDAGPDSRPRPAPVPEKKEQGRPVEENVLAALPEVPLAEPPVFYRPAGPDTPAGSGPVCGDLRGAPKGGRIVFPLERQFFYSYDDTWGAPRTQGGHEGTDLMTPSGVPEYAITDGTVVPVAGSDADGWNALGGHAVMVRADYSMGPVEAGDLFYYAHLERESPLRIGTRVSAGQVVGYAGDTGQGPPGTSGLFPPHLHLGWYDGTGGREEAPSGAMNPYPLLEWIKSNGGAVTGGSEARFCEAPRTGPPTPSAHDGAWPSPADPGLSPDLATNSGDPRPDPPTQRDAPAKKPSKPDHPDLTKKTSDDHAPKPPQGDPTKASRPGEPDRQDPQRPARPESGGDGLPRPEPDSPDRDPQGTTSPDPGDDQRPQPNPEPPEKDPTKPGPTDDQYDEASTGGPSGSPEATRPNDDPKPKTHEQDDADNDGGHSSKPSQHETPPGQSTDRNP